LKAVAIIQARIGSSRFTGKIMMKLYEKFTVLDYVIRQLGHSKLLKNIIIATTYLEQDNVIVEYAKNNGLAYFRGESLDVLDRYYKCAKEFSLDTIVRMTSDAPFLDPTIVDKVISKFQETGCDFASNNITRTYPIGIDAEVFSMKALEKTWKEAELPSEREHVTSFMKKNTESFKLYNLENNQKIPIYRLAIDRKEDLGFLRAIAANITKQPILMKDIYELFLQKPEILDLYNDKMSLVEGYNKSLKDDEKFLKKLNKNGKKADFKSFKETIENN
jgi:spore coat polysaccharide biosynthesis protein SpsF